MIYGMIVRMAVNKGTLILALVSCACALVVTNSAGDSRLPEFDNVTLGPLEVTDYSQKIKLKPVTRAEFKRKIRETSDQYELLRIFFDRTDLPEVVVDDLIDAGSFEPERGLRSRGPHRVTRVEDPDIQVHGEIKLLMQDYDNVPFQLDGIDDVYEYLDEIEAHPMSECSLPQPEIVRVATNGESGKIYYPECIVVHRCRNVSGCCDDESEYCGPKSIKIFRKPFLVLELLKGGGDLVQPDRQMVEYRNLINHTECECKKTKQRRSCDRLCPVPFARLRTGAVCKCGCRQDSLRCRNIETGFESLQASQLVCIKEGRCRVPHCMSGSFNIRTGFCPMTFESDFVIPRHNDHPRFRNKARITEQEQRPPIGRIRNISQAQLIKSSRYLDQSTKSSPRTPQKSRRRETSIHKRGKRGPDLRET